MLLSSDRKYLEDHRRRLERKWTDRSRQHRFCASASQDLMPSSKDASFFASCTLAVTTSAASAQQSSRPWYVVLDSRYVDGMNMTRVFGVQAGATEMNGANTASTTRSTYRPHTNMAFPLIQAGRCAVHISSGLTPRGTKVHAPNLG
jgi:hypothetical protein